jgi:hypothetical protein
VEERILLQQGWQQSRCNRRHCALALPVLGTKQTQRNKAHLQLLASRGHLALKADIKAVVNVKTYGQQTCEGGVGSRAFSENAYIPTEQCTNLFLELSQTLRPWLHSELESLTFKLDRLCGLEIRTLQNVLLHTQKKPHSP